jgi:hypothetical protein
MVANEARQSVSICLWAPVVCGILFPFSLVGAGETPSASAWSNDLGKDEIILPGFSPLAVSGRSVVLGTGRTYAWSQGLLPAAIFSRGRAVTGSVELLTREGGVERTIRADSFDITHQSGHDVELVSSGFISSSLSIDVAVRTEYDGVAIVDVTLTPSEATTLEGLELRIPVVRNADTQVLAFDPDTVFWYARNILASPCYSGSYKNAVGFVSEDTSFWWFADEVDRQALGDQPTTSIECEPGRLYLRQPLINGTRTITAPVHLRFAFLAGPVRELPAAIRADRVVAGLSSQEAALGDRHLWWVEGVAHYALPDADYPPGALARLPPGDISAYPGAAENHRLVESWRRGGIERLPYLSLRAPSALDPVVAANLSQWQVLPVNKFGAYSDPPYRAAFPRPLLSLNASGYPDYLLNRLDALMRSLNVRGFYFDQAGPLKSANPMHLSAAGAAHPGSSSTDILAMRDFFKRLATMTYKQSGSPLIYVHNSTTPVLPAYTFVTAMVQGEEMVNTLHDLDYQASVDLDYVRGMYTAAHAGVPTIWLEEIWSQVLADQRPASYQANEVAWLQSAEYARRWRNFMAMALLHDLPVWSFSPAAQRRDLYGRLDQFGIARSTFIGYWKLMPAWRNSPILVSRYVNPQGRALAVVANMTDQDRRVTSDEMRRLAGMAAPLATKDANAVVVGAHDFILQALEPGAARQPAKAPFRSRIIRPSSRFHWQ